MTDFEAANKAIERWLVGREDAGHSAWELGQCVMEGSLIGPIDTVLEIGTHDGRSLDVWNSAWSPSCSIGIEYEDSERTRAGLDPLIANGTHIIFGPSDHWDTWSGVKTLLGGRGVDFLYIDGDHRYPTAKRDFLMYSPLVRPGGLIVMDDCTLWSNPTVEVYRLIPEVQVEHRTKIISGPLAKTQDDTAGGKLVIYSPPYLATRDEGLNIKPLATSA